MIPFLKTWIKKRFAGRIYRKAIAVSAREGLHEWVRQLGRTPPKRLREASYDIFTYHGEDGIIGYLLSRLSGVPSVFADIGSGDCIKSNCASLAIHEGWKGCFLDIQAAQLEVGKRFYRSQAGKGEEIRFLQACVTPENVNGLLSGAGLTGEIGLLSIDIDGNDFWIWKAIGVIRPRIVVIEAKVEFGIPNRVVPYARSNHHSADKMYNGASVEAMKELGRQKGYKLAGANKQGYNLFFVQEQEPVPGEQVEDILSDPETLQSFYPPSFFSKHQFSKA